MAVTIQVTGWRFCGDDDDSVDVRLLAKPAAFDTEQALREEHKNIELDEDDEDEPVEVFFNSEFHIGNGYIFKDEDGKPWRVSIKRVRASRKNDQGTN